MTVRALIPYAFLGLSLLEGCVVTDVPPPTLLPAEPPAARIEDVSGDYCYYGPDYSVRAFRLELADLPFFDFSDIAAPALIHVEATTARVVLRHDGENGAVASRTFDVAEAAGRWAGASLLVPMRAAPGFHVAGTLGSETNYFRHGSEAWLSRLADGRLVMSASFNQKGLRVEKGDSPGESKPTWFEKEDSIVVILQPTAGGCAADLTALPLQPLFEPGLDIRAPACAATLEEQVVSILVEKGEPADTAPAFAHETVTTLSSPAEARRFTVRTTSTDVERTYFFQVSEKSGACTLRLTRREKRSKKMGSGWPSSASRPLPGCACVD